jgi:hypothetical protein
LILLLSPEKVPFFLASYLPLFSVFIALFFQDLWDLLSLAVSDKLLAHNRKALLVGTIFLSLAAASTAARSWTSFREFNNADLQFSTIRGLEEFLAQYPGATYYDVVGTIPRRATLRLFAGPNDPWVNKNTVRILREKKPHLVFYVNKSYFLEPGFSEFLRESYFTIATSVHARWHQLPRPIPIRPRDQALARAALTEASAAVGRDPVEKFSALVREGKSKPRRLELTMQELFRPRRFAAPAQLLALSPFTTMPENPGFLPSIIRFDWYWTGNEEPSSAGPSP